MFAASSDVFMAGSISRFGLAGWKYSMSLTATAPMVRTASARLSSSSMLPRRPLKREMTTAGVQRPGLIPRILNSSGRSAGLCSVSAM